MRFLSQCRAAGGGHTGDGEGSATQPRIEFPVALVGCFVPDAIFSGLRSFFRLRCSVEGLFDRFVGPAGDARQERRAAGGGRTGDVIREPAQGTGQYVCEESSPGFFRGAATGEP